MSIRDTFDDIPIGGPPLPILSIDGCNRSQELFNQVKTSINCVCNSKNTTESLCKAIDIASILSEVPFSCMFELLTGQFSQCDVTIPPDKQRKAFEAFSKVTGYEPANLTKIFDTLTKEQKTILAFNAFYVFVSLGIIILIAIWIMAIAGWFTWATALFLTVFLFVILYLFNIGYRVHVQNHINSHANKLEIIATETQNNFENSIV